MLDFRMDTFLTVCRCMNYTRASEELNITQPAVSQHIRYLENYYQTKLFRYEGKKMRLTESGEMLREAAVSMQQEMKNLQRRIHGQEQKMDRLHLGASPAVGESVMAEILERCIEKCPETKVSMEVADTQILLERINVGEVDFALADGDFSKEEYEYLSFSKEKLVAVCSHAYFEKNLSYAPASFQTLTDKRILLCGQDSGERKMLDRYLCASNFGIEEFKQIMEIDNLHTVLKLVRSGYGITFLFEHTAKQYIENGELIELKLDGFQTEQVFTFLWRKGSIYTEMYREMFGQLAESV